MKAKIEIYTNSLPYATPRIEIALKGQVLGAYTVGSIYCCGAISIGDFCNKNGESVDTVAKEILVEINKKSTRSINILQKRFLSAIDSNGLIYCDLLTDKTPNLIQLLRVLFNFQQQEVVYRNKGTRNSLTRMTVAVSDVLNSIKLPRK